MSLDIFFGPKRPRKWQIFNFYRQCGNFILCANLIVNTSNDARKTLTRSCWHKTCEGHMKCGSCFVWKKMGWPISPSGFTPVSPGLTHQCFLSRSRFTPCMSTEGDSLWDCKCFYTGMGQWLQGCWCWWRWF